jgi:hypothetical protein
MGAGGSSCCGGGCILFILCLFIGGCVGGVLLGLVGGVLLGLVGVGIVIGRYISVTACCVDLYGFLFIKVATLAHDLLLLLLHCERGTTITSITLGHLGGR